MLAFIEDAHDAHGAQFTLRLIKADALDDAVMKFLHQALGPLIDEPTKNRSTLYLHRIQLEGGRCALQFVEATKKLAAVDYHHNHKRGDGKYTVLVLETDDATVPSGS